MTRKIIEYVYTLKVYPYGKGRSVYRVIEINGRRTLEDLCHAILNSFDFDHDHMYEFNLDGLKSNDRSIQCSTWGPGRTAERVYINELRPWEGMKFYLHYDFGDDWIFVITVQKIMETEKFELTRVISSKGAVEQYRDWG